MALLSIITPTFNAARYLGEMLDSVAALDVEHEHIVVDGGSTDGTVELLQTHGSPVLRWVSEPDRGQTHAVNKGLRSARGDVMAWINGDDLVVADRIRRAVEHFESNPDCAAVYAGLDFIDAAGQVRREYRPAPWSFRRYLILGDYVPPPAILFRRSRYQEVGPLDERWEDAADYDFYLRLMHLARVDRLPGAHVRFRYYPESKSGRDPYKAQGEALQIRLQWASTRRQRAAMIGFDRLKRALLPHLRAWPAPFAD